MLLFAKQRVTEAGLPDHVVRMYLEQSKDRLKRRMRNIIKNALRSAQPANQPTMSTGLDETPASIARQTKYSTLMNPSQRKAEAVKRKLDNELIDISLIEPHRTPIVRSHSAIEHSTQSRIWSMEQNRVFDYQTVDNRTRSDVLEFSQTCDNRTPVCENFFTC